MMQPRSFAVATLLLCSAPNPQVSGAPIMSAPMTSTHRAKPFISLCQSLLQSTVSQITRDTKNGFKLLQKVTWKVVYYVYMNTYKHNISYSTAFYEFC